MKINKPIQDQIFRELHAAKQKFPAWPTDPLHALAILGEEFGELSKTVLQMTYEPHKTSLAEVKNEAIQTAAMAVRFLESLDRYDYRMSKQHEQSTELSNPHNPSEHQIEYAAQQLIGFSTAKYGHGGIVELADAMGLTANEWSELKKLKKVEMLKEIETEELDNLFLQSTELNK